MSVMAILTRGDRRLWIRKTRRLLSVWQPGSVFFKQLVSGDPPAFWGDFAALAILTYRHACDAP